MDHQQLLPDMFFRIQFQILLLTSCLYHLLFQFFPFAIYITKLCFYDGENSYAFESCLVQPLTDPVKSELDNAYHVTCSIAAEYHCMEEAAANMAAMSDICCDSQTAVYVPALAKLNASAAIDWYTSP